MLKTVSTAVFGVSLLVIMINSVLDSRADVFVGGIVSGTLAVAVIAFLDRKAKAPPASPAEEILRWTRERDNLRRSLDNARAEAADDRVAFLEPRLAEAEGKLRKLGG